MSVKGCFEPHQPQYSSSRRVCAALRKLHRPAVLKFCFQLTYLIRVRFLLSSLFSRDKVVGWKYENGPLVPTSITSTAKNA